MPYRRYRRLFAAVIVGGLLLAAGREFYQRSILPLRQQEAKLRNDLPDLRGRIIGARQTVAEIWKQEKEAEGKRIELKRLKRGSLEGEEPPMVAVPASMREHFTRAGLVVSVVRLNTTQDEPELPGCQRVFWSVALPIDGTGHDVAALLQAVADLDQQGSFVRVLDFAIRPDPENAGGRVGLLNVTALIGK